ncbi:MAG TPA: M20/M25/M40 family metallo-hydrolase [Candidatus Bathyarchaeia archaeon]|nr:M20/M25/M40 family metallo-hydrolase [Candidatus Bathyarchaeia archaeon]
MKKVYEFIDENSDLFLEEFREFIRKPGISTENTGIKETVNWLVTRMKENGLEDVQVFETQRHPVILGRVGKAAKRTLLVYGHYDVQPPGDKKDWKTDPFAAEFVDGRIIGRGTCDMKNNLMASVHAIKALVDCTGSAPINLIFLFEGEEEIGSPNLKPFIERHNKELSACDSILCGDGGGENKMGQALLVFGLKGLLSIELQVESSLGVEFHSGFAGITSNPAWRLISALRCLREDDHIVLPHFFDGVNKPSSSEKAKYGLAHIAFSKEKLEEALELKVKEDMSLSEAVVELFYKPTLNINGLSSGYTVKGGTKTIVPNSAWARIDARLVPSQDPSEIFRNIQKHLASKGFNDVLIEMQEGLPAYRIEPDERIAQVCSEATKKVVNPKTMTLPVSPGSGAMAWLPHILGKPMAFAGSGPSYMAHRPNEFITKEQYLKGIRLFATIYEDYAS